MVGSGRASNRKTGVPQPTERSNLRQCSGRVVELALNPATFPPGYQTLIPWPRRRKVVDDTHALRSCALSRNPGVEHKNLMWREYR